jgi:flagellar protein FlgJ
MFDKQISLTLTSGRGIGLAEQMIAQLRRAGTQIEPVDNHGKNMDITFERIIPVSPSHPVTEPSTLLPVSPSTSTRYETPAAFVRDIWPHARRAAEELGVDPKILVAQAALETGWGKHIPTKGEGQSRFNVFGIKAGSVWSGATVEARTQEFIGESFQTERSRFRAYNSLADSFSDYVNMIQTNPRFKPAQGAGSQFINFLQQGGYATDPDYVGKINRIVNSDVMQGMVADFKA